MSTNLYQLRLSEFENLWKDLGLSLGAHRRLISEAISKFYEELPATHSEISNQSLQLLRENIDLTLPKIVSRQVSKDSTIKYLIEFEDTQRVESVALSFNKKYTLCLSSQVGCAMKCDFCFTGEQGLSRHLKAHEIIGQYLVVWRDLKKEFNHKKTPNIVFMGQGEPLHNFDEVKRAVDILCEFPGLSLGPKQMTLSTVGYLPGLLRWSEFRPINLAISLHSAFDEQRSQIIPTNKVFKLEDLFECLNSFSWHHRKRVNFEYLLLGGLNDSYEHAQKLADLIENIPNMVNIIPFNPYPGARYKRPDDAQVKQFKKWLVKRKLVTMVRVTKGEDILGACGQLANHPSDSLNF